jgi:hypothetical protein
VSSGVVEPRHPREQPFGGIVDERQHARMIFDHSSYPTARDDSLKIGPFRIPLELSLLRIDPVNISALRDLLR